MKPSNWPRLRADLRLSEGARDALGHPTWTLHDPVRHQFFQLDWPSHEILRRWSVGDPAEIARQIQRDTVLEISAADVLDLAEFLSQQHLLQTTGRVKPAQMALAHEAASANGLSRAFHQYLFWRVPLCNPDAFLSRWQPRLQWLGSRFFLALTLLALLWGLIGLVREWDRFALTALDTLNLDGLWGYGAAIVGVKLVHELAHAFTAKRMGCQVPTMGVAFILLWPMAYTDTHDSWKLKDPRERMAISRAGIWAELFVAAWALWAWTWLPTGLASEVVWFLATTSLATTLLINANPFMRFDGYFILTDHLNFPNLHARSFAMARWQLREWLFGFGQDAPEPMAPGRRMGLIVFAGLTWLYRLVLFFGIALLVYEFFFKLLGILMFVLEVGWFIVRPLVDEVLQWRQLWLTQPPRRRTKTFITASGVIAFMGWLVLPTAATLQSTAVLKPAESWAIYAPMGGQIEHLAVAVNQRVQAGDLLVALRSPEVAWRSRVAANRVQATEWESRVSSLTGEGLKQFQLRREQAETAERDWERVQISVEDLNLRAPTQGVLRDLHPELHPGQWIGQHEKIAVISDLSSPAIIETYLDETAVSLVRTGSRGTFHLHNGGAAPLSAEVIRVEAQSTPLLPQEWLASAQGGHISGTWSEAGWIPRVPHYRVTLTLASRPTDLQGHLWRGHLVLEGEPRSWLAEKLKWLVASVLRELNL